MTEGVACIAPRQWTALHATSSALKNIAQCWQFNLVALGPLATPQTDGSARPLPEIAKEIIVVLHALHSSELYLIGAIQ